MVAFATWKKAMLGNLIERRVTNLTVIYAAILSLGCSLTELHASDVSQCEIINKPIDCKRLTRLECQQAKQAQHQRNLNIQHACAMQAAAAAAASAAGGAAGGGSEAGASGNNSEEGQGEAAEQRLAANGGQEQTPNELTTDNQQVSESLSQDISERDDQQSESGTGPSWGASDLCKRFKAAYNKATNEESRKRIREQAKRSKC